MTPWLKNCCVYADALSRHGGNAEVEYQVVSHASSRHAPTEGVISSVYVPLDEIDASQAPQNVYVPSLFLSDKDIDFLVEYTLENKVRLMVKLSSSLYEVGKFDVAYSLSPVMFLHSLGLMPYASVLGAVYLDKDDASLIAQEKVPIILLPSESSGNGDGIANVVSYLACGADVFLGTGECKFNRSANLIYEAQLLQSFASATMNSSSAISYRQLSKILTGSEEYADRVEKLMYEN